MCSDPGLSVMQGGARAGWRAVSDPFDRHVRPHSGIVPAGSEFRQCHIAILNRVDHGLERCRQDLKPQPQVARLDREHPSEAIDQVLGESFGQGLTLGKDELNVDDGHVPFNVELTGRPAVGAPLENGVGLRFMFPSREQFTGHQEVATVRFGFPPDP